MSSIPQGPGKGCRGRTGTEREQEASNLVIRLSRTPELHNTQDPLDNEILDSGNLGDQDLKGQKVLQLWVSGVFETPGGGGVSERCQFLVPWELEHGENFKLERSEL